MTATGGRRRADAAVRLSAAAVSACVLFTGAVLTVPALRMGHRAPDVHVMLETANAVVALLVGFLLYGRFRQSARVQELLLTLGLTVVAVANLALTALPSTVSPAAEETGYWAAVPVRLSGTLLIAVAALVPRTVRTDLRRARQAAVAVALLVVAGGTLGVVWGHQLSPLVAPALPRGTTTSQLVAHPAVLVAQALGALLYGVAALFLLRQSRRAEGDELLRWLAAGCVLAGAARVHHLLFPSTYSDVVHSGDVLRLGFHLFLLIGALREIESYWRLRTDAAVSADRRRLARELHDGVVQELAYIRAQSRQLAGHAEDPARVDRIAGSAERATDEARRAIAALTRPVDLPFPRQLEQMAEEMASRHDVEVVPDVDPAAEVTPDRAEALLRITGEAVRNAIRHGDATRIDLVLHARPLSLVVLDNGCGFPADSVAGHRPGGFGLVSMRERAALVRADLAVESAPGEGTTVRVSWP